jgi:glycosyltransferase involved in cell wall biosynthesis
VTVVYALTKFHQPSQTFVELEIAELRRRGVDVRIVSVEHGEQIRTEAAYLCDQSNSWSAHAYWLSRHPLRYLRFLTRVARLHREMGERPERVPWRRVPSAARDIGQSPVAAVHAHFGWSGAALAALLGALVDAPWSMTLHAKDIFAKPRYLARKLAMADAVVTVCDYNRRWMREQGLTTRDVAVITCGIEPGPPGPSDRDLDVVAVGRFIPKKGFDVLIRAFAAVVADGHASLDLVGEGPEEEALRRLARDLGVADRVRFHGALPHHETLDMISRAKVFSLPCRVAADGDRDAMPTVLIEAMLRATPVVTTRVGGIPEMVDETVGRITDPDEVDGLAIALGELLSDAGLLSRLGTAARQRAQDRFSVEGQAGRLLELLTSSAESRDAHVRATRGQALQSELDRPA